MASPEEDEEEKAIAREFLNTLVDVGGYADLRALARSMSRKHGISEEVFYDSIKRLDLANAIEVTSAGTVKLPQEEAERAQEEFKRRRKEEALRRARAPSEALCGHLRMIGLDATVVELKKVPRLRWPGLASATLLAPRQTIAVARVADRNIDLVELEEISGGDDPNLYQCSYLVWAKVEGLEDWLRAELKPVRKGFLRREIIDIKWEGKALARELDSDASLKDMLYGMKNRIPSGLEIEPDREDKCVRIRQKRTVLSPVLAYPTAETFEAFDRIAQHIARARCSRCSHMNNPCAKFCEQCGASLPIRYPPPPPP